NKPGDWEQVRGGDTDNNKRHRQTNIGKHMAGTRKHEDKTREQTCDNTKETNAEINTDRTQTLQNTCCYLYYLLPVPIYWGLVDCPLSLVGIFVSVFTIVTLNCNVLSSCLLCVF